MVAITSKAKRRFKRRTVHIRSNTHTQKLEDKLELQAKLQSGNYLIPNRGYSTLQTRVMIMFLKSAQVPKTRTNWTRSETTKHQGTTSTQCGGSHTNKQESIEQGWQILA